MSRNCSSFVMTLEEVREFMVKQGMTDVTLKQAANVVHKYDIKMRGPPASSAGRGGGGRQSMPNFMSQEGFRLWFSSDEFAMAPTLEQTEPTDPDHPVFDYFIQASFDRLHSAFFIILQPTKYLNST